MRTILHRMFFVSSLLLLATAGFAQEIFPPLPEALRGNVQSLTVLVKQPSQTIHVSAWKTAYRARKAPERIVIEPLAVKYLEVAKISVADLSVEQIRLVSLGVDALDVDALTVFTFDEVLALGKMLKDAVEGVRFRHALETNDMTTVLTQMQKAGIPRSKTDEYFMWRVTGRKAKTASIPFFTAVGEVKTFFPAAERYDAILVPVYEVDTAALEKLVSDVAATGCQVILALDMEYDHLALMKSLNKWATMKNVENEPVIHSLVIGWGKTNNIDLKVGYEEAAVQLDLIAKTLGPDFPTWFTLSYTGGDSWLRWLAEAQKRFDFTGIWLWNLHSFPGNFKIPLEQVQAVAPGKPVVLGGFFGYPSLGQRQDWIVEKIKKEWKGFPEARKAEGWAGVCVIAGPGLPDAKYPNLYDAFLEK